MRELIRKIIVALILIIVMMNSQLLLIISQANEVIEEIMEESKINPLYEINIEKYVNYNTQNEKGTLLQIDLKTGIEYEEEEDYHPLKLMGVFLKTPKIEDKYPTYVEVIGKATKATNGSDTAKDFQYTYDKEKGELKIVTENKQDENGNLYSDKVDGAKDAYTIIFYYDSDCYRDHQVERNLEISGFVQTNIANNKETVRKTEIKQNYTVTEDISGLVSTQIETSEIYNGYINSNHQNGTKYKTEFIENLTIDISKKEIADEIVINTQNNFMNKNEETMDIEEIIYKSTKINKNQLLSILGEDGYLQILNENGQILRRSK